jgi:hypothetical protein
MEDGLIEYSQLSLPCSQVYTTALERCVLHDDLQVDLLDAPRTCLSTEPRGFEKAPTFEKMEL